MTEPAGEPLRAPHLVRFAYQRAVGGATGRFLVGLSRRELWGSRTADGRVVVPPLDHDPDSGEPARELVRVADRGTVRSWTWVASPAPGHPLPRPFAFALIRLDGADTELLHVVDVGAERELAAGLRVRAVWREPRTGSITDIEAFRLDAGSAGAGRQAPEPRELRPPPSTSPSPSTSPPPSPSTSPPPAPSTSPPPSTSPAPLPPTAEPAAAPLTSDLELHYRYEPGRVLSSFLRELGRGRVAGGRCPGCAAVYVPPRPRCPACGAGPMAPAGVADRGVVISYAVTRVPPHGSAVPVPFAWAWIRLDGADVPFPHLLGDLPLDEIRVGLRVRAVWVAAAELAPTWASIRHFGPER
jgi:uncharacterized OB-fold protein